MQSGSVGLLWDLRVCISNELPAMPRLLDHRLHLEQRHFLAVLIAQALLCQVLVIQVSVSVSLPSSSPPWPARLIRPSSLVTQISLHGAYQS